MGGYLLFSLQVLWDNRKVLLLRSIFKLFLAESSSPSARNRPGHAVLLALARLGGQGLLRLPGSCSAGRADVPAAGMQTEGREGGKGCQLLGCCPLTPLW